MLNVVKRKLTFIVRNKSGYLQNTLFFQIKPYIIYDNGSRFTNLSRVVIDKADAKSFEEEITFILINAKQHSSV